MGDVISFDGNKRSKPLKKTNRARDILAGVPRVTLTEFQMYSEAFNNLDSVEVLGRIIPLTKMDSSKKSMEDGEYYKGVCPFCNYYMFVVSRVFNNYHCSNCNRHGTNLGFFCSLAPDGVTPFQIISKFKEDGCFDDIDSFLDLILSSKPAPSSA
jgi:hypothetical protein